MRYNKILLAILAVALVAIPISVSAIASPQVSLWKLVGTALQPMVSTWTLGSNTDRISHIYADTFTATTATIDGVASSNLVPSADDTYDLGSPSLSWQNIYTSGLIKQGAGTAGHTPTGIYTTGTNEFDGSTYFDGNTYAGGTIYTGSLTSATDPGSPYRFMSFPMSATPAAGTRNNAVITMGTEYFMSFYGENTGTANAVQNESVNIYKNLKIGNANQATKIYVGTADGCGVWQFSTSSTSPTLTPTSTSLCL